MYKVLIADDNPAILEGLPALIDWQSVNYEITAVAENGQQALDLLRTGAFDLCITDIRMPTMDGITLAKENQQLPSPCKLIILSAYSEFHYAQEAMQYGVRRYLLKPISEELLLQMLIELREELRRERNPQSVQTDSLQIKSAQLARTMTPIIGYIQDHCTEKLSLQEIASRFYINSAYLGRIFKQYTGTSFNAYLINCRINLAKKLLRQGLSVTETASMVSYEDIDYFARLFRQQTGMSPSEFRSGRKK